MTRISAAQLLATSLDRWVGAVASNCTYDGEHWNSDRRIEIFLKKDIKTSCIQHTMVYYINQFVRLLDKETVMFKLIAMKCKISEIEHEDADSMENSDECVLVHFGTVRNMIVLGTAFMAKAVNECGERAACYVIVDANGTRMVYDEMVRK